MHFGYKSLAPRPIPRYADLKPKIRRVLHVGNTLRQEPRNKLCGAVRTLSRNLSVSESTIWRDWHKFNESKKLQGLDFNISDFYPIEIQEKWEILFLNVDEIIRAASMKEFSTYDECMHFFCSYTFPDLDSSWWLKYIRNPDIRKPEVALSIEGFTVTFIPKR